MLVLIQKIITTNNNNLLGEELSLNIKEPKNIYNNERNNYSK